MNASVLHLMAVSVLLTNDERKTQTVTERYKYREGNILYITLGTDMRKRGEGT